MTHTSLSISQANIQAIEQLYTFRERSEVVEFLDKHPFLLPVLLEAPEKICHYFPDSQLFLGVFIDPESIDWVQLVISVLIKLDPYDAVRKLNHMDMEWWVHTPYEVRKNVSILPEYPDEF
jgi:hypothetical protein